MPNTTVQSTSLYYQEGTSDKVYHATLEKVPDQERYVVNFSFGRRGNKLQRGTKTSTPLALYSAQQVYDKLVASKLAKGYTEQSGGTPFSTPQYQEIVTGILPQLLNTIDEAQIEAYINNKAWIAQPKHDGRRMLVEVKRGKAQAINRRGLAIEAPLSILSEVEKIARGSDLTVDGELVGETYHIFDILKEHEDIKELPYSERLEALSSLLKNSNLRHCLPIESAQTARSKKSLFNRLKAQEAEGIVFKSSFAPYTAGRPASGGSQVKFKFVEMASAIVLQQNGKRSVSIGFQKEGVTVNSGKVSIPPNASIPQVGTVIEVKYLYAMPGTNALYQPIYLGQRDDITQDECTLCQLKYKG